ncbi:Scr1 family TA system antitoxin-like transcriptional regulator [Streptomyces sp. NBC_01341]|uniref:Scr1 family TA system antitoxin-like transcriptional regulator n=1 Tax=Streptomyces sp. NBC_01341 TaxID=2903831 RepID=UPI002E13D46C|nr:Scr1 family TA system antitoxin-like transcriptional regulator [Streptomyces sp. NBC_01341]
MSARTASAPPRTASAQERSSASTSSAAELIEEPAAVTRYRLSYDRLRDRALPPPESIGFIRGVLEEQTS